MKNNKTKASRLKLTSLLVLFALIAIIGVSILEMGENPAVKGIHLNAQQTILIVASFIFVLLAAWVVEHYRKELLSLLGNETAEKNKVIEAYHHLVNDSLQGLSIRQDNRFVFVNRAFAELSGYSIEELYEFSPDDLLVNVYPDDQTMVIGKVQKLEEGTLSPERYEFRFIRKDKTIKWVEVFRRYIEYQGKPALQTLYLDITERKSAENAYHTLVDNSLQGLMIIQGDRIVFANEAAATICGYATLSEFLATSASQLGGMIHSQDPLMAMGKLNKKMAEMDSFKHMENRFTRKDGSSRWAELFISTTKYLGTPAIQMAFIDITDRKEAEQAYRSLIDNSLQGLTIIQDNQIVFANQIIAEMIGYSVEESYKLSPQEIKNVIHPEDQQLVWGRFARRLGGEEVPANYEFRILKRDGTIEWVEAFGGLIEYRGRPAIQTTYLNISERKKAEDALKQSESRYRLLAENAQDIIWTMNMKGKFTYVSSSVVQLLGYSVPEFMQMSIYDVIARASLKKAFKLFNDERHSNENGNDDNIRPSVIELEHIRKDNTTMWAEVNLTIIKGPDNRPISILGITRDITKRRKAEQALADEKERLAVTLRSIGEAVITTDIEGKITLLNKIAEQLLGINHHEAIGIHLETIFKICDEKSFQPILNQIEYILHSSQPIIDFGQIVLIDRDNSQKIIEESGSVLLDNNGNAIGIILVFRDVTETRRLKDLMERAQRLEAAGQIAGQVAHDFNNLLGPMIAYPEIIRAELKPDHPAIHLINDIEKAAVQIADVNQQLLTLGRRGNFNLEPLNINDVVLTALGQIYPTPENLMIETKLSSNLKNIQGNGSQIHRLLTNLIVNARDAIDDSGEITVETRNVIIDNYTSPNSHYPAGDYVLLSVSDTGSGIPVEVQPKIFDPFFTTKSADQKRGSGLGLSVVRAVVDDHGGYIDFDTGPDKGTKFNIYFPITQECVIKHGQERIIGGSEHLLVIDNDIVQSSVTQNLLEKLGYRVTMAESGEKALELMKINSYDLLVIDTTQRHGIDAAETFKRARKINHLQKAIITSGYVENKLVDKTLKLGAAALIKKPLTLKIIAFGVRKALDEPNRVKDQPVQIS